MSFDERERVTDSLLHPGRGHTPSYGLNEDVQDSDEGSKGVIVSLTHTRERVWTVAVFSLIACIGSLLIGMFLGYSTNTLDELDNIAEDDSKYGIKDHTNLASIFGSFGALGAIFGGPVAWPVSDFLGRKPALMLGGIPALIGWLSFSYANLLPTRGGFIAFLIIGRVLTGFASGWLVFCVSVYIAEVSTSKLRGLFGNCNQLFITIGIFVVEALGSHPKQFLTYTSVALIAAGIVVTFEAALLLIPETPRWYYKHGKELEGNRVLVFLRGSKADVPKEIRGIQDAIASDRGSNLLEKLLAFRQRSVFLPFLLVLMLMFFQQFSGINAAVFYSSQIFTQADISNPPLVSLLAVGLVQIFATFVSVVMIDLLGRKVLLVISSAGMCLSSAGLGIYFLIFNHFCGGCIGGLDVHHCIKLNGTTYHHAQEMAPCDSTAFGGLAIASVVVFIISFSLGWGPIPWSMMSELLPLKVRGLAGSFATMINWTFAFIITLLFNKYARAVTPKFAWWSFAIVMVISIVCVLFLLPETKGHKLEEIEEHFKKGQILYNPCKRERRGEESH